ncbi:unnamed protein product [Phytophthora fragariaefolia]|uniref:Unnamed protein product n=1 Tax=Phytophthora fragariaefolia TaxID=1490495 RepID=A0A9W6Y9L2_9STRA|nr:unnamed protein product [Phytophthora fragariaefolia]
MEHWGGDVPLIGVVPNLPALSNPSMLDFEGLFRTRMLTDRSRRFQQYNKTTLVTAGLRRFLSKLTAPDFEHTLFVTHVSRNDIILGFLSHAQNFELTMKRPYGGGLILTGSPSDDQPQDYIMNIIKNASAPVLYVPTTTFAAMEKITHFTGTSSPFQVSYWSASHLSTPPQPSSIPPMSKRCTRAGSTTRATLTSTPSSSNRQPATAWTQGNNSSLPPT